MTFVAHLVAKTFIDIHAKAIRADPDEPVSSRLLCLQMSYSVSLRHFKW